MKFSIPPDVIRALENSLDRWASWLLAATLLVVLGLILEYWHEVPTLIKERPFKWKTLSKVLGALLITVGVAGELIFGGLASRVETTLRATNEQQFADLGKEADNIRVSADKAAEASGRAESSAQQANKDAGDAGNAAHHALREADSFEKDIVSAKNQATEAESHLAVALQRAAAAESELNRLETPRSLTHSDELIAALKPFTGTEYTLNVYMDDESIQFTRIVASALDAAGWVRKQPAGLTIGIPTIRMILNLGVTESVPACLDTGIGLDAHTKESVEVLNSLPFKSRPKTIQAALTLKSAIALSIYPPDARNVVTGILDPKLGNEAAPITICVGKKP